MAGTGGEAGEAGEPAGNGGSPIAPTAGQGGEAAGTAEVGGVGGAEAGGAAGQVASGGEGGVAAICFNDLNSAAGEAGAGARVHEVFDCNTALAALTPTYDAANQRVVLDVSSLGPVANGTFTFYYDYTDPAQDEVQQCGDAEVQVSGDRVLLPLTLAGSPNSVQVPLLQLHDACGGDATLSSPGLAGTCFNLTFSHDTTWTVDCFEGSCPTTCAENQ